ncbi:YheC/YheD family protein [Paenibacillus agilis]|uniref:YheC/YheD family protein n=1 Tax=Paenibacillus agilis TaxID=3020863 RepID=A0A559IXG7_9BACL|nr:YheC/YheD family protein [Paenibacillus agilis]TVX92319.1 YheC/YheD family protein [Paenibacillus agilis]
MSKLKLTLQVMSPGLMREQTIMLGDAYVKKWKIPVKQPITLRFGSLKQPISVTPIPHFDGIRISQQLAMKMGMHSGIKLRAIYKPQERTLNLGPLIGILISRDRPDAPEKPFGQITTFCTELVEASQDQGAFVCFFTPDHIQDHVNSITAWVHRSGNWMKTEMPIPNIVNNRLTSRKTENKPSVQHFMKEVKQRYQSSIFNEKFLDKTEVFDALKHDQNVAKYLPESYLLKSFNTLKTMCSRHPQVFLKPARGSLGKGIVRISRSEDNSFYAMYSTVNGTRKQHFPSLLKLFSSLTGKMKTNRYQIQQGLQLMENEGRPVDFRALVQKNAANEWSITSIVARTAGTQHFVSNLARGGTLSTVKDAVTKSNLAPNSRTDVYLRLKNASLEIAQGIDMHIPAHFGELGIDLAVDTSGKVWLIEVNSKPSKNDNTPLQENKIRPSVRKVVEYARYLSGF